MRREYGDKGFYITRNKGYYSCRGYSIIQTAKRVHKRFAETAVAEVGCWLRRSLV